MISLWTLPPSQHLIGTRDEMPRLNAILRCGGKRWRVVDLDTKQGRALVEAA